MSIVKPLGLEFASNHMSLPFTITSSYLAFIYLFTKYMRYKEAYSLKQSLVLWNTVLCIFSFIGAVQTVPMLLYMIYQSNTFNDTICTTPSSGWGQNPWIGLFIYSKIPELGDTVFIIARKKRLMFLHWYHHVTVLLYCWHSYATEAPQSLYFVAMNYSVHSIMYGYYALCAINSKPKWLSPVFITIAQITQMIVGVVIQMKSSYIYMNNDISCPLNGVNVVSGGIMYASYFALFSHFAVKRYAHKKIYKTV